MFMQLQKREQTTTLSYRKAAFNARKTSLITGAVPPWNKLLLKSKISFSTTENIKLDVG